MRSTLCSIIIVFLFNCQANLVHAIEAGEGARGDDSKVIELTILWKAELDPVTWRPIALDELLSDTKRFNKVGNFYEVKDGTKAFGHEALYIGLIGIDVTSGPNATIQSSPQDIAEYIESNYEVTLEKVEGGYRADLKKDVELLITAHPNLEGASMIIGAYFGR
jgi:hypothetical protein